MTTDRWYWQIWLVSALAVAGAIASSFDCAKAQITPDNTLGAENSVVTPNADINGVPSEQIDGGAIRGANLFHSFEDFNVGEGRGAYFINPAGIDNILSRVTGSNPSAILGKLGVLGNANLFLMNPNGIIFGPSSSLDLGSSFVATTANAIQFSDQGFFSAFAPDIPPVLTVNPSAFLFNQIMDQPITNQSLAGLQVPTSQSLLLLGGDVRLDGGRVGVPGGRAELGGLAGAGTVRLNVDGSLSYPDDVARANISFTNGAEVNVRAAGGGSITINAGNLDVLGGSRLRAGIASGLGSLNSQAGNVEINATGAITLADGSVISNTLQDEAVGSGGDINIKAGLLSVTDGAQVASGTRGRGNAGNVTITTRNTVSFDGIDSEGFASGVINTVEREAEGNSGNINITAVSLSATNGAVLGTSTRGQGDAGNIDINVRDTVSFDGVVSNLRFSNSGGSFSGAVSQVAPNTMGNGGNIDITAGTISVRNGAQVSSSTFGQGNAGNITINVRDTVSVDGVGSNGFSSAITSNVGGDIAAGKGGGGNINIMAGSLYVTNGGGLAVSTFGQGNGGSITINARDIVSFDGVGSNGFPSVAASSVEIEAVGKGGDIDIAARLLSLTSGAGLSVRTSGQGDAGNIEITALDTVSLRGGAQLVADSFGQGNAGSITINARDTISFDGVDRNGYSSGAFSSVEQEAEGNGGNINVTTGRFSLLNSAGLSTSNLGQGDAGNIKVSVGSIKLENQAALGTEAASSDGGNITLQVKDLLLLRRNSRISATAGTAEAGGDGGNIDIDAGFIVALEDSDITANAFEGRGGNVEINTQGDFRSLDSDITATSQLGIEGQVEINTPDVDLQNSLTQLAANFVSSDQVVAGSCLARRNVKRGSFTVTGTGGLPSSPYDAISSRYAVTGVQPLQSSSNVSSRATVVETVWKRGDPIQEAQGMVVTADGRTIVGTTPQLVVLAKTQSLVCHSD